MQRRGYEPLNAPSNGFIMIMEPNLMNNTANIYFIVQILPIKSKRNDYIYFQKLDCYNKRLMIMFKQRFPHFLNEVIKCELANLTFQII